MADVVRGRGTKYGVECFLHFLGEGNIGLEVVAHLIWAFGPVETV